MAAILLVGESRMAERVQDHLAQSPHHVARVDGCDAALVTLEGRSFELVVAFAEPDVAALLCGVVTQTTSAKIMIVARHMDPVARLQLLSNGVDYCLSATCSLIEIMAWVNALLRRTSSLPRPREAVDHQGWSTA